MIQKVVQARTVLVDGIRIGCLQGGVGPPLVLLHGLIGSASNWALNLPALARVRTVYALDAENMGDSDRVAGLDWGLCASADRVARAMEVLGLAFADLIGSSRGGAVAMMLAARHSNRVRNLILFAPANPFCTRSEALLRFFGSRPGHGFARQIPRMPRWIHAVAHRRVYGDPRKATPELLKGYTRSLNPFSVEQTLRIVRSWSPDMEALSAVLPVVARNGILLIWGERDGVVGATSGRRLAEILEAEFRLVPGAGHLPFAEEPELCNRWMVEWLNATPPTRDVP